MRGGTQRIWRWMALLWLLGLLAPASSLASATRSGWKTVGFRGYEVSVPRAWPVYNLARHPGLCVRFDRHAVYLGVPARSERCPAHVAGRSDAILLEPVGAAAASASGAATTPHLEGSVTSFLSSTGRVKVVATWSGRRSLILRALHRDSLPSPIRPRPHPALDAHAATAAARAAQVTYTGRGFDACSAPSPQTMAAWGSSPYRALGIYIGGANAACAQPNLTSGWVAQESAAGWSMIPTYVGLQAPSNTCGCAGISSSQASAQGTAAAEDAVNDAQALGLPAGSPIYDDMESYSRTQSNTSAVMAFLASWTSQLHLEGYLSGVYGNSNSVIADLVARYGTTFPEPDDIWMASWNGQQTTSDPNVPATDWANHQRLHQYSGAHNETYGGVTINIDSDYLDGQTAVGGAQAIPPPTLKVAVASAGMTHLTAAWGGSGLLSWQVLAGTDPSDLVPIGSSSSRGPSTSITVRSSASYFAVQALGPSGQLLAASATVDGPAHLLLFGQSVFVNAASGMAGVPVGCYLSSACHVATTVTLGRTTLARTGTESVGADGTGLVFFRLTPTALRSLTRAGRLSVQVTVKDVTGPSTAGRLKLVPFATSGRAPSHSVSPSPLISPVGFTDFVYAHGAGGVLASCAAVYACRISATLTVGRTTIASTHPELVNGRELGYLIFSLTSQGRQMLDHTSSNQLGASLTLRFGSAVARARIGLVQFR